MAELIWTDPALQDLDAIADYIALDKPAAAANLVARVFEKVERLKRFPNLGAALPELPRLPYRQLVIPPCRLFYRVEKSSVIILHVMRAERLLNPQQFENNES